MKSKKKLSKGLRLQIYAWSALVAVVLLIGGVTFAWYTMREREAETTTANVMKPYYLNLMNPSETAELQLSVGSLLQGQTKQIVFCVTNKDNASNTDTMEYALELVHTDNLALNYEIYSLEQVEVADGGDTNGLIVAEDTVEVDGDNDTTTTEVTYWQKNVVDADTQYVPLNGEDVSATRHEQVGLTSDTEDIINRGTYIYYKYEVNSDGSDGENLQLEPAEGAVYDSRYFVLEISWQNVKDFSLYDKETDMIWLLAKAVQPEPASE